MRCQGWHFASQPCPEELFPLPYISLRPYHIQKPSEEPHTDTSPLLPLQLFVSIQSSLSTPASQAAIPSSHTAAGPTARPL